MKLIAFVATCLAAIVALAYFGTRLVSADGDLGLKRNVQWTREDNKLGEEIAKEGTRLALLQQKQQVKRTEWVKICQGEKKELQRNQYTGLLNCAEAPPAPKPPSQTAPAK